MTQQFVETRLLGARYVAALFRADSHGLVLDHGDCEPEILLEAVRGQLMILGRRVASESGRTLEEVGADLLGAARAFAELDAR